MNLYVLLIALLVYSAAVVVVNGRAINDDVDNSIEVGDEEQVEETSSQSSQSLPISSAAGHSRFGEEWLRVTKAPPAKILQNIGSPVEITCEVMGSQVPTVQWVVGNVPLSEIDGIESNVISETSSSTIAGIRSIHIIDHMLNEPRTYTCVGHTGSKTVYASTIVYPPEMKDLLPMHEKQFVGTHKPRITYNEKFHLDLVGSNLILPCKIHARPRTEIFWMNGKGKLITDSQRFKVLSSGELLIADLKWEDMGAYKCIARNNAGKDTAETFVYPVLREPEN